MEKKFKAFYATSAREESKRLVGIFSTIDEAIDELYQNAKDEGDLYDCDNIEKIRSAISRRGFYMVGYGPREMSVEEV